MCDPLRRLAVALLFVSVWSVSPRSLQAPAPISYTLRFPAPRTHYVEVEAVYPTGGRPQIELYMAVWTPGSYLVREYERHVENVSAAGPDGKPRAVSKTRKNRWRIETAGTASVTVRYLVYGREMTVRNNWIETGFAMINGAPTFLTLVESEHRPHDVRIELPAGWARSSTALTPVAGQKDSYRAEDFDTLVDSPIVLGNSVVREFDVAGKRHTMVFEGDPAFIDADRAAADAKRIVETAGTIMGRYDYPHYHFLTLVTDAGGGLEHKNSTMLMTDRFATRTAASYFNWNSLVAHEYFHNWNVKRLRPVELGPFDYENEVPTRSLWIAEGFTDYYSSVILRRAGIASTGEFLADLSSSISGVQTTPGRAVTAVGQASYDTWIKQYRPDENTPNTTINYYPKGAVIGFLLDVKVRAATGGAKSLDDVMRLAYTRYSGAKGYTPEQFYATASEVAGRDLSPWFAQVVETADELDYSEALDWLGLRFRRVASTGRATLGATTKIDNGRLLVSQVRRGTPAFDAGINVDDEVLAIDDVRVRVDGLAARLAQYRPGDRVVVTVARRDRLTRLTVTLGAEPGDAWGLEPRPDASPAQQQHLAAYVATVAAR